MPEDEFENFIEEKKQAVNDAVAELITSGLQTIADAALKSDRHRFNFSRCVL